MKIFNFEKKVATALEEKQRLIEEILQLPHQVMMMMRIVLIMMRIVNSTILVIEILDQMGKGLDQNIFFVG